MNENFDAFEVSPVPAPGPDAVVPPLYRGIYGMPAFVSVPTTDLAASVDFWTRGLGFFELFSIPGTLVHLRRWAFQDVLLVKADAVPLHIDPMIGVAHDLSIDLDPAGANHGAGVNTRTDSGLRQHAVQRLERAFLHTGVLAMRVGECAAAGKVEVAASFHAPRRRTNCVRRPAPTIPPRSALQSGA